MLSFAFQPLYCVLIKAHFAKARAYLQDRKKRALFYSSKGCKPIKYEVKRLCKAYVVPPWRVFTKSDDSQMTLLKLSAPPGCDSFQLGARRGTPFINNDNYPSSLHTSLTHYHFGRGSPVSVDETKQKQPGAISYICVGVPERCNSSIAIVQGH